jgi:c-di-GMP-binding flagellar brake protein YcgR
MPTKNLDKRRYPRIPAQHAVLVKKLADDSELLAKTEVMGGGGCMFVHDAALTEGSRIEILISVRGHVVKAVGRVAYALPRRENGAYEVGVEFLDISADDRAVLDSLLHD